MAITGSILDEEVPRGRSAAAFFPADDQEFSRVMCPLKEVMLLVVCATIAGCDDFDDICAWGRHHLDFLHGLSAFLRHSV
jgi:hypothetical protein